MTTLPEYICIAVAVVLAIMSIRRFLQNTAEPLLPEAAYVANGIPYSAKTCRDIDRVIASRLHTVPTTPGRWFDNQGDIWSLGDDDRWTDPRGDTRGPEWTPLLALYGPWSPVPAQTSPHNQG